MGRGLLVSRARMLAMSESGIVPRSVLSPVQQGIDGSSSRRPTDDNTT
jgi:hypothetical protein